MTTTHQKEERKTADDVGLIDELVESIYQPGASPRVLQVIERLLLALLIVVLLVMAVVRFSWFITINLAVLWLLGFGLWLSVR